jgi:hypothetical protein
MLQFTDEPFSCEPALTGIVTLVQSLARVLVAFGRASNAPWVEFLPPPPTNEDVRGDWEKGTGESAAAAALKGNDVLIALGKCKEAARKEARLCCMRSSLLNLTPPPPPSSLRLVLKS